MYVSSAIMPLQRETTLAKTRELHQEVANTLTHGLGLLLSVIGTLVGACTFSWPDAGLAVACRVYGDSLVQVYVVSTLSHAIQHPAAKHHLRAWDQGIIYWLNAGTYTPFIWVGLENSNRWIMLTAVWSFALLGFCTKVFGYHRINSFSALSYIILGWGPAPFLFWSVPMHCSLLMLAGGISYTLGILFLINDHHHSYFHAAWHIAVIMGSAFHFVAIAFLLSAT